MNVLSLLMPCSSAGGLGREFHDHYDTLDLGHRPLLTEFLVRKRDDWNGSHCRVFSAETNAVLRSGNATLSIK